MKEKDKNYLMRLEKEIQEKEKKKQEKEQRRKAQEETDRFEKKERERLRKVEEERKYRKIEKQRWEERRKAEDVKRKKAEEELKAKREDYCGSGSNDLTRGQNMKTQQYGQKVVVVSGVSLHLPLTAPLGSDKESHFNPTDSGLAALVQAILALFELLMVFGPICFCAYDRLRVYGCRAVVHKVVVKHLLPLCLFVPILVFTYFPCYIATSLMNFSNEGFLNVCTPILCIILSSVVVYHILPLSKRDPSYARNVVVVEYRKNRENGDTCDNPKRKFPNDGRFTLLKGIIRDDLIYGVKNSDNNYEYECRYDEGLDDKKWMGEKDRNYLARLKKEGKLQKKEPEEFKKRQEDEKKRGQTEEENRREEEKAQKQADVVKLCAKGSRFYAEKKYAQAIENFKGALKIDPECKEAKEKLLLLEALKNNALPSPNNLKVSLSHISYQQLQLNILNPLGQGGFGKVYNGEWNGQKIAFKELLAQDQYMKNDFENEAKIMARFSHPCIVKIHGICIDPNHYGIVMELMSKGSLWDLLRNTEGNPMPWKIRYSIAMDITSGLCCLHQQDIAHCDLKSQNILLDGNLHAKISDFGLSETRTSVTMLTRQLQQGGVKGSPLWMAPEVCSGAKPSRHSDVYSYGVILWELASYKMPWKGKNCYVVMLGVINGKRENIPNNCPKSFATLIGNCWKKLNERQKIEDAKNYLVANEQEIKGWSSLGTCTK